MNNCILMAEIVQDPQLRYTPDQQIPVTEMLVQFPAQRAEDPPYTLKVVGWRNLAQEMKERCHVGLHVVVEGRLGMNTIDRPEGFKEKRAELTLSRLHYLGEGVNFATVTQVEAVRATAAPQAHTATATVASAPARTSAPANTPVSVATKPQPTQQPAVRSTPAYQPDDESLPSIETDVDDIPF